jgi:exosortase A
MERDHASPDWRWPGFLFAIAATVALYWPTVATVLSRWTSDPTYSHGWLVLAISVWLAWRCRRRGKLDNTGPSAWGLVLLIGGGLGWLLARAASIHVVQQLAVPTMMLGMAWVFFGWRGLLSLLVPIGVLYFVMPAWDYLRPVLQNLTVDVTGVWLDALGVAVFIHGNRVDLAAGSFVIVEGCSGLHFFMAAGALASIQAYLYIERRWAQGLLLAAALAVALLANWIRVVAVIYAGHVTEMQSSLIRDHYYFGWVIFMLLMVPVFMLGQRLETLPSSDGVADVAAAPGYALPVAAFIAVALPVLAWWSVTAVRPVGQAPVLPSQVGTWTLDGEPASDWRPLQPGAAVELGGRYKDGSSELDAWVVYYPRQTGGAQLVGYGSGLARPDDGTLHPTEAGPGELRLHSAWGTHRLIRYRYEIAGRVTASRGRAKLLQALGNLGGRPDAYGLMISARCDDAACRDARNALVEFETALGAALPVRDEAPGAGARP